MCVKKVGGIPMLSQALFSENGHHVYYVAKYTCLSAWIKYGKNGKDAAHLILCFVYSLQKRTLQRKGGKKA